MREEDRVSWLSEPFRLLEGSDVLLLMCLDNTKHYVETIQSSGFPIKLLELHSKDEKRALATVFSYNLGMRFMVVFDLDDVRPL